MIHAGTRSDVLNSGRHQPGDLTLLLKTTHLFNDHLETILTKFLNVHRSQNPRPIESNLADASLFIHERRSRILSEPSETRVSISSFLMQPVSPAGRDACAEF